MEGVINRTHLKSKTKGDFKIEENWEEYFEWLGKTAIEFQNTFFPY